jgi:large subunit ribosomal protein L29
VKVDELRVLEVDELDGRLRQARRELYELRFKHAVGQLENSSQISKVRHDIARIMTVLTEREYGIVAAPPEDDLVAARNQTVTSAQGGEGGASAPDGEAEPPTTTQAQSADAKPKRTRKPKAEETT